MSLLTIKDLEVAYGHIVALRGISLTVKEGEIVTIIGTNGAGKSTTLKAIIGNLRPRRGEILFEGAPTHGASSHHLVQQGMALVPEGRRIFPSLTVKENLESAADREVTCTAMYALRLIRFSCGTATTS